MIRHLPLHDLFSARPLIGRPQTAHTRFEGSALGGPQGGSTRMGEREVAVVWAGAVRNTSMPLVRGRRPTIKAVEPRGQWQAKRGVGPAGRQVGVGFPRGRSEPRLAGARGVSALRAPTRGRRSALAPRKIDPWVTTASRRLPFGRDALMNVTQEATKRCPFCSETILADAIKCKHCQSDLRVPPQAVTAPAKSSGGEAIGIFLLLLPLASAFLIWFWVGQMNLLQGPDSSLSLLGCGTILTTAILVAAEGQ